MSDDKRVHDSDLDDIIGIAAERQQHDDESLSVEEVKEVAEELDIDADHIDEAVNELQHRKRADLEVRQSKSKMKMIGAGIVASTGLILVIIGGSQASSLSDKHTEVEQARAQLDSVLARKKSIRAMWEGKPDTPDKMAALEGAENRVHVEAKRYDAAATQYNKSTGFWSTVTGSPSEVPLSTKLGK